MAKADIIVNAVVEDAKKKLDEVADSLQGVAAAERPISAEAEVLQAQWGELAARMREAGATAAEVAEYLGLTKQQMVELGYTAQELTGVFKEQGVEWMRVPGYVMGYRGGWLNLIATLTTGYSIFRVLHAAVDLVTDKLLEGARAQREYRQSLLDTIVTLEEFLRLKEEEPKFIEGVNEAQLMALGYTREMIDALKEQEAQQVDSANIAGVHTEVLERFAEAMQKVREQRLADYYREGTEAALEQATSVEDLTQRIAALYGIQESEIDASQREAIAHMLAAHAAEKHGEALRNLFDATQAIIGVASELQGIIGGLGDAQETYRDRTEDILFAAGQAWESYSFRVQAAIDALNFRLMQAQVKFDFAWAERQESAQHAAESRVAQAAASARAAAARHALSTESIIQDHYDKLEDMERSHQEELRRMLQRAPWYLQREIRDYQKQKKDLEARGDKEGLAQLKRSFIERIRAIDPVYAEELEHLEDLQQDERDVEEREFRQRLSRENRQFAISRELAAAQAAIAQADAEFALRQQNEAATFAHEQALKAAIFAHEQQLASMEFSYGQQAEASARAQAKALEEYQEALKDISEEFLDWGERMATVLEKWGFYHGQVYKYGFLAAFGKKGPEIEPPEPPSWLERGPGKQMGMPYVPTTMPVVVHPGEAILRKEQAEAWRGEGGGGDIYIQFYGPVYMRTRQEVRELAFDISRELARKAALRRV